MRCFNCCCFQDAGCPYESVDPSAHICDEFLPASEDEIPYSVLIEAQDEMSET